MLNQTIVIYQSTVSLCTRRPPRPPARSHTHAHTHSININIIIATAIVVVTSLRLRQSKNVERKINATETTIKQI